MRALVYHGPQDIRPESLPDPSPQSLDAAVVRVLRAGICGSDLHIYHGHGFTPDPGYVVGHEAVGEIVEIGSGVRRFAVGDRVLIPASSGCAICESCRQGWIIGCETAGFGVYGVGHTLQGSQAEAVAVPSADTGLRLIPDSISDEQAILLTDNLPTSYFGARRAGIEPGDTVAVVGLGPGRIANPDSAGRFGSHRSESNHQPSDGAQRRRRGLSALRVA